MQNDMPEAKEASAFYRDYIKRIVDLLIAVPVLIVAAIPMLISNWIHPVRFFLNRNGSARTAKFSKC